MIPLLYDAICTGTPRVMRGNWEQLVKQGWSWVKNLAVAFPEHNTAFLEELQQDHGRENVACGFPFVVGEGPRTHNSLVGVYVRVRRPESIQDGADEWPDTFPVEWLPADT